MRSGLLRAWLTRLPDRSVLYDRAMGTRISAAMFVGRKAELAQLNEALAGAGTGRITTVLLSGDAGVGKSRLVSEFCDRVRSDATILRGGCLQIDDGNLPFVAIAEALRGLVRDVKADQLRRMAGESCLRVLGSLAPAMVEGRPPGRAGVAPDDAQVQLFDAALHLLERLAQQRPTVLVLEDIHWADRSTRDLLLFLTHNLHDSRILIVATHRGAELGPGHPLRVTLSELVRSRRVRRVELEPFGRDETAAQLEAILAAPPRADLVDRIHARTQGNAFFVEELIASGATARDSELPTSLREVLLASVDTLTADSRAVLRAAAAAGRRVQHELLAQVMDENLDLDAALRHITNRRILEPDVETGTYAFRHALFAEAVRSTLLPGERERLHRRLAQALEADRSFAVETPAAELAVHWQAARDTGRTLTSSLEAAVEAQALRAVVATREHLERALVVWDEVPDAAERTGRSRQDVVTWLAETRRLDGDMAGATTLLDALIAADGGDDPSRLGGWLMTLGHCRDLTGDHDGALAVWRRVEALVPATPPTAFRAHVLATIAGQMWEGQPADGLLMAQEAVELARAVHGLDAEAAALRSLGACAAQLGRTDEAVDRLLEARAIAMSQSPAETVRADIMLSAVLVRAGRASDGADAAAEGISRARELGLERLYGQGLLGNVISGLFLSGRWGEVAAHLQDARSGEPTLGFLRMQLVRLAAFTGRFDDAQRMLDEDDDASVWEPRWPSLLLALETLRGDLDAAHEVVLARATFAAPAHAATQNRLCAWALRVQADRGAPDRALCDALLAETTMERSGGSAHARPWQLTAEAEHTRCTGSGERAAWEVTLTAWQALGWPYQVAYSRYRLAGCAIADGDLARATELLRAVIDVTHRLGAKPLQHDAFGLSHRAGLDLARTRQRSPAAVERPYGLTSRETEVLSLVADGHSNRAIGERLHISPKTASVHVSNILRKLEVRGRTEAASVAIREGLTTSASLGPAI